MGNVTGCMQRGCARESGATGPARVLIAACVTLALTGVAMGQGTFSLDYQGPLMGVPDACTGAPPLTEGDILRSFTGAPAPGPSPTPCIFMTAGGAGLGLPLYPAAVGHGPGVPGMIELDALSYGRDQWMNNRPNAGFYNWYFSVDEFSGGFGPLFPPDVFTEGAFGALEASADIFVDVGVGIGPFCFPPAGTGNTAFVDGDGFPPFGGFGLGLIEPNPFGPGVPDPGSNLDAVDIDTPNLGPTLFPVYFSLDSGVFDALEGLPNTTSALANGLGVGGDVFVVPAAGAVPIIFAPAPLLGLDIFGVDSDDIDALVLRENGTGVFEPSIVPFDWLTGATDMLMFSLRRDSALVVGAVPDSLCGLPIEPGDILVPPAAPGLTPGIWIPAEALGLATARAGFIPVDDIDALDTFCTIPGDLDGDGDVDLADLALMLANYGCVGPPPCVGDINGDGVVNLIDLALMLANYGRMC